MPNTFMRGLKSVVLTTLDLERAGRFYRDVLGLPIAPERHRGTDAHWAGDVGGAHLAIHPQQGFWLPTGAPPEGESTVVSFTVVDLAACEAQLRAHGVEVVARRDIGPMKFIAFRDPDGRLACCGTPWPGA